MKATRVYPDGSTETDPSPGDLRCEGCGEYWPVYDDPNDTERVIVLEKHRMPCPTSARKP